MTEKWSQSDDMGYGNRVKKSSGGADFVFFHSLKGEGTIPHNAWMSQPGNDACIKNCLTNYRLWLKNTVSFEIICKRTDRRSKTVRQGEVK